MNYFKINTRNHLINLFALFSLHLDCHNFKNPEMADNSHDPQSKDILCCSQDKRNVCDPFLSLSDILSSDTI